MLHREKRENLRAPRPAIVDRLAVRFSTSRHVDGLWVGTMESKPQSGLRRVEEALQLIKDHDALHYSRVINNLDRIWVKLLTNGVTQYEATLNACVFDLRHIVLGTTTSEWIAAAIVHDATHARLRKWDVIYDEKKRARITAICIRRELNFVARLPQGEPLRENLVRLLEWTLGDPDYFTDAVQQKRTALGEVEAARHVGMPDWLFGFTMKVRAVRLWVSRFLGRA